MVLCNHCEWSFADTNKIKSFKLRTLGFGSWENCQLQVLVVTTETKHWQKKQRFDWLYDKSLYKNKQNMDKMFKMKFWFQNL